MKIVTVPHNSLRKKAPAITKVDKKLIKFVDQLQKTLVEKENPSGVGLAAPQVDKNYRAFATYLPDNNQSDADDDSASVSKIYINPKIIDHSEGMVFGPNPEEPTLEGCLSIPGLYGPVPRFQKIKLEYGQIVDGELKTTTQEFEWFPARVIQHELDHLDGILFTDYSLKYDLPVYALDDKKNKMIEIDKKMIEIF